jgi:hypothetical protein
VNLATLADHVTSRLDEQVFRIDDDGLAE